MNEQRDLLNPICKQLSAGSYLQAAEIAERLQEVVSARRLPLTSVMPSLLPASVLVAIVEESDPNTILNRYQLHVQSQDWESSNVIGNMIRLATAGVEGKVDTEVPRRISAYALKHLHSLSTKLSERLGTNPDGVFRADAWMDGTIVSGMSSQLGKLLEETGDPANALSAYSLCAHFTIVVFGHYPHHVIPSMNDLAACLTQLQREEEAAQHYQAVIKDFNYLVHEYIENTAAPEEDERSAIDSLKQSYLGYHHIVGDADNYDSPARIAEIEDILNRPQIDD